MKRVIMNILTTTGIVLVILAIIALCYEKDSREVNGHGENKCVVLQEW